MSKREYIEDHLHNAMASVNRVREAMADVEGYSFRLAVRQAAGYLDAAWTLLGWTDIEEDDDDE